MKPDKKGRVTTWPIAVKPVMSEVVFTKSGKVCPTPWSALPWFAPRQFSQPISPTWTFGNVFVTAQNSSAPETEEIVSAETYDGPIGTLLDAVCALVQENDGGRDPAFENVLKLKAKVDQIKSEAAKRRIDQLKSDLELLENTDRRAFDETFEALRTILPRAQPSEST